MVVFYEYMVTFGEEVELFWSKSMNGATVLFLATRYLNMLLYAYMFVSQVWPPDAIDGPVSSLPYRHPLVGGSQRTSGRRK